MYNESNAVSKSLRERNDNRKAFEMQVYAVYVYKSDHACMCVCIFVYEHVCIHIFMAKLLQ